MACVCYVHSFSLPSVRAQAQTDLENWNTQRDIRLQAKKETNRSEEQGVLETLESEVEMLKTWDRVGKLIDTGKAILKLVCAFLFSVLKLLAFIIWK